VSAFQRASDPEIIFSASTQRLEAKTKKRKNESYQGEEFIKAKKQGQAEMAGAH
jgi:hypothetical protein